MIDSHLKKLEKTATVDALAEIETRCCWGVPSTGTSQSLCDSTHNEWSVVFFIARRFFRSETARSGRFHEYSQAFWGFPQFVSILPTCVTCTESAMHFFSQICQRVGVAGFCYIYIFFFKSRRSCRPQGITMMWEKRKSDDGFGYNSIGKGLGPLHVVSNSTYHIWS